MEKFIQELKELDLYLKINGKDLLLVGKEGNLTASDLEKVNRHGNIISFIKDNKKELFDFLNKNSFKLQRENVASIYELCPAQEGILFHSLYLSSMGEEDYATNLTQNSMEFTSEINVEIFKKAWQNVIENHTTLRTGFITDAVKIPVQFVNKKVEVPFLFFDYSQFSQEEANEKFEAYRINDAKDGFSFTNPPLMRITLIKFNEARYTMIWTRHHILLDGWSTQILLKELLTFYTQIVKGIEPVVQKEDLFEDHIKYLKSIDSYKERAFWKEYFNGFEQSSLMPFTSELLERNKGKGAYSREKLVLDKEYTQKVVALSKSFQVTTNTLMQGVWAIVLSKYTNLQDIIFGVTVSGRPADLDYDNKLGLFINTLPLRCKLENDENIGDFFRRIQQENAAIRNFQHTAINTIKELNSIKEELFDSLWVFNNFPVTEQSDAESKELSVEDQSSNGNTNYLITIHLVLKETLGMFFSYNSDLIEEQYIKMMCTHIKTLLDQLLEGKSTISSLNILSAKEQTILLNDFNDTAVEYPRDVTLVDVFEKQVAKTPNATALVFEGQKMTYSELNFKANQLANYLIEKGVQPDTLVGICIDRSFEMLIGILGILKSGGAYVPIDPEYPESRVDYILEDTHTPLVLVGNSTEALIEQFKGKSVVNLEQWDSLFAGYSGENTATKLTPSNLAYVIYTSGSTGQPKGVMNEHLGVVNRLFWARDYYKLNENDVLIQKTTFSFDVSVWELLLPLQVGCQLIIAKPGGHKDSDYLIQLIKEYHVSMIHFVPSMLSMFLLDIDAEAAIDLKNVVCSGEALKTSQVIEFQKKLPTTCLSNLYGPTEAAIDVTSWIAPSGFKNNDNVVIGKPVANTQIIIVDQEMKLVPVGVIGELCIGGVQVARGYLNRPDLNEDKFIANPFHSGRLYKTGDKARWLADGSIEYIGRSDAQVKIRGYRIELGEIEHQLQEIEGIVKAVVLVNETEAGDKQLIAYVVSQKKQEATSIKEYLYDKLPEYMVPAQILQIEKIPITNNGKLDKKALKFLNTEDVVPQDIFVAPKSETEEKVQKIWKKVLEIETIGVHDNFFRIGGHSLHLMRLVNEFNKVFNIRLGLKQLYKNPTIETQALLIASSQFSAFTSIPKIAEREAYPVSDAQKRLWLLSQFPEGSVAYNMPAQVTLKGKHNIDDIEKAINLVIERHEILRTVFKVHSNGEVLQHILSPKELGFKVDFQTLSTVEATAYIKQDSFKVYDLEKGPLLRVSVLQTEDEIYVLYFNMHHIISDGWSMNVLKKDFLFYYESIRNKRNDTLPALRIQYKDYANWQLEALERTTDHADKIFWMNKLQGELPVLDLPSSKVRPNKKSYNGTKLLAHLGEKEVKQIKAYTQTNGGSLFTFLLTTWNIMLYNYTATGDIVMGTPIAGRNHSDLSDQIGFFVNTLALRNQIQPDYSFDRFYKEVTESTLLAFEHQNYPFDRLVEDLKVKKNSSRSVVFDIMLILQNAQQSREDSTSINASNIDRILNLGQTITKFDLDINCKEFNSYLSYEISFNNDVYDTEMISDLMGHYKQLVKNILKSSKLALASISYLSEEEETELLYTYNDTKAEYPSGETVLDLFNSQVQRRPEAIAVIANNERLTYKELAEKSTQFALHLMSCGVERDTLVPICMDRSVEVIIGLLGILKAGGAYVPIDPNYPKKRIDFIIEDTNAKIIVTKKKFSSLFHAFETEKSVIYLDVLLPEIQEVSTADFANKISPEQLINVIYTSGTTGQPKGVMIEHKSILNHARWSIKNYKFSEGDNVAKYLNFAFDASAEEIYPTLLSGATLNFIPEDCLTNIPRLNEYLIDNNMSVLVLPSVMLQEFTKCKNTTLRMLIVGGEKIEDANKNNFEVFNHYGPTETTVTCLSYQLKKQNKNIFAPIGNPIDNASVIILDTNGKLVPKGMIGELHIGGVGLSRGYLNNPILTNEKFVTNPYNSNEKLYKSGDLARRLPDGKIEFIGRKDEQVKIRGYRIELGEIEHAILNLEEIENTVVQIRKSTTGENDLIAFIVATNKQKTSQLRASLKAYLPDYMIPSYFIQVDQFKLTSNGKVDKKDLETFDLSTIVAGEEYVAPRDENEEKIAQVLAQQLGKNTESIGVFDQFFDIGATSIRLMTIAGELSEVFGIEITVVTLFEYANIDQLNEYIKAHQNPEKTSKEEEEDLSGVLDEIIDLM
ncbi:non-ribosomal peptide synthetase [Flavobacterium lipolyticum]|uniref:Amino acid adenylation domain-containing protein n=1 Tax=Flavobacterium lipolyticum TaxID=2893754 RepID=A0ABS8M210_9FLAO|nr:non-ribosomal peptide synthetase [Flavobacterium sp. F-126]MCC9018873.1 amino acid adenylation domain-containing protein [Flavobacterium sp. F-126]